jgi:hypothetical protein
MPGLALALAGGVGAHPGSIDSPYDRTVVAISLIAPPVIDAAFLAWKSAPDTRVAVDAGTAVVVPTVGRGAFGAALMGRF